MQLLVMVLLQESMYGYQIVRELEKRNYIIEENTLYPLLRRLNNKKILQSNWEIVEGKPRKYYQISEDGKKVLEKLIDIWLRQNQLLKNLLGGSKDV
ncbi:PadR family transcriptional regulator [Shimazuella kribbensis]|uniref:PadR family transcriptional regulator n=1 Tax=Shimazuella kribbensis TaxID=139808 RepID=UPI001B7FBE83|nr:PadR family transcriptional regulator [Shimazuella kribbensis]